MAMRPKANTHTHTNTFIYAGRPANGLAEDAATRFELFRNWFYRSIIQAVYLPHATIPHVLLYYDCVAKWRNGETLLAFKEPYHLNGWSSFTTVFARICTEYSIRAQVRRYHMET